MDTRNDDQHSDMVSGMQLRAHEDVLLDAEQPFRDVHRLVAWAGLARDPAPEPANQDLLPYLGPALRRMQIARRMSDTVLCERAGLSVETWQRMRQGQDVGFPEFTRAFLVIAGGAFLPLREAATIMGLERRYARALKDYEAAPEATSPDGRAP